MAGLIPGAGMPAAGQRPPHVQLTHVSKRFGGVRALTDVDLRIEHGSVHALVGENGAGKSTLGRIVAGLISPDSGELRVDGTVVAFSSPRDALLHGIATIAQERALVPGLSVADNVYLGSEPRRVGFVRRRRLRADFQQLRRQAGFDLPPDAVIGSLRMADQQKVEILRALSRGASVIIMDEPTAALSRDDRLRLHEVVRSLAASGHTVLLVSHFLSEVLDLADTVTILRDGRLVRTGPSSEETESSLIEGMLGRSLGSVYPPKQPAAADAPVVLDVRHLRAPGVHDVSLQVRAGEIVGLAGLVGAGRSEIAHAVVGAARRLDGSVQLDGSALPANSPARALRRGTVLIPESRKTQGLLPERSIRENATIASLPGYSTAGWVRRRREKLAAAAALAGAVVHAANAGDPVSVLSGGNQQKVMFARAMLCRPRLLIADEPTIGVDVGSRRAIYDLLVDSAARGVAVLVISSDLEEVLALAHRVLVIRGGQVVRELAGEQMTETNVLTAAFTERSALAEQKGETAS